MKLVEMKCKNCGAKLKVNADAKDANCQFCGAEFKIDDEVQHVKYDDMEQAGYEFEKGKIRAQQEHKEKSPGSTNTVIITSRPKKFYESKTFWIVMAWIFLLPFTATYYILKNKNMDNKMKIIIIAVMWVIFIIIGIVSNIQSSEEKKNKIIECYSQETYDKLDELIGIDNIDGYFSDTYSCDEIQLKDQHYKKIDIEMNGDELVSIQLDNKCIYNVNETVDIYDPKTLRIKKKNTVDYYKDDESINMFINKYNRLFNPDITENMISKKHIGGRDRDDIVIIANDKLEINIYGSGNFKSNYEMEVYIGYIPKVQASNDEYKEQFIKYIKTLNESLTTDEINQAWYKIITENKYKYKIKNIIIYSETKDSNKYFKIISKKDNNTSDKSNDTSEQKEEKVDEYGMTEEDWEDYWDIIRNSEN